MKNKKQQNKEKENGYRGFGPRPDPKQNAVKYRLKMKPVIN